LWSGTRNQIVTGDLEASWTKINDVFQYRKDEAHHGDQLNVSLRMVGLPGSIVTAAKGTPMWILNFQAIVLRWLLYPTSGITAGHGDMWVPGREYRTI